MLKKNKLLGLIFLFTYGGFLEGAVLGSTITVKNNNCGPFTVKVLALPEDVGFEGMQACKITEEQGIVPTGSSKDFRVRAGYTRQGLFGNTQKNCLYGVLFFVRDPSESVPVRAEPGQHFECQQVGTNCQCQ